MVPCLPSTLPGLGPGEMKLAASSLLTLRALQPEGVARLPVGLMLLIGEDKLPLIDGLEPLVPADVFEVLPPPYSGKLNRRTPPPSPVPRREQVGIWRGTWQSSQWGHNPKRVMDEFLRILLRMLPSTALAS
jgi:hypothetical protein